MRIGLAICSWASLLTGASVVWPGGKSPQPVPPISTQFLEVWERDYSHPSIVGWFP